MQDDSDIESSDDEKKPVMRQPKPAASREEAERTLADEGALLNTLLEEIPDNVYFKDAASRFIRISTAMARHFGLTAQGEAIGKTDFDYFSPEHAQPAFDAEQRIMKTKRAIRLEEKEVWPDGSESWVSTVKVPILDSERNAIGTLGISRDITASKRSEQRLIAANREMDQILASITSMLVVIDGKGRVSRWNKAAEHMFGLPEKKVLSAKFTDIGLSWDSSVMAAAMKQCIDDNIAIAVDEIAYRTPEGQPGSLSVIISPYICSNKEESGLLILGQIITDRKRLEGHLVQAQKLESIGQLAAGLAHEINTPIQFIGNNANFIKEGLCGVRKVQDLYNGLEKILESGEDPESQLEKIKELRNEIDLPYLMEELPFAVDESLDGIKRVTDIVSAMKVFSGTGSREKTLVDLNQSIRNTITITKNEWKHVAEVEMDFDDDLPLVPCNSDDLFQVTLNLVVNAVHTISEELKEKRDQIGRIRISTKQVGNLVELRISDTGTGIPEEIRDRVFDPFFTTKEVGNGSGLGLSLAYSVVVQNHDGSIEFETEMGEGTTFIVALPLKK